MIIKPSSSLRTDYNSISDICKKENKPVFLTKKGEGDLVLMSIEAYTLREEVLDLREKLLEAEALRLREKKRYAAEDIDKELEGIINDGI
ncbi:MAG: type II toxin-antitoxin system Phd/YefM family antitoxin [Bacteroides sp.]|nr:type II toxin-antitoxin system Phd/YefM family antitoxin [Bacteroides sp.]